MPAFSDSLNIPGHLKVYKLSKYGVVSKVFDEANVVVSGMGVGLSYLLSTSSSDSITDYQLSKFQVGVSGWSGNQVSSTYQLSGPLSSTAEYGVDSHLQLENTYQIKNGKILANNIFALIPKSKVTQVKKAQILPNNDVVVRYTIVLDEEACSDLDSTRGNVGLNEIGLFMKNPTRTVGFDAPILVAYRTFPDIRKTSDFSLIFRWTLLGSAAETLELPWPTENPDPGDGATGIPLSATLSWDQAEEAVSYAVYLGTTPVLDFRNFWGNQSTTTFIPYILEYGTTFYWRIDSIGINGTTTGTVWSFTTEADPAPPTEPPAEASNPSPASGVSGVSVSAILSWDAASGAAYYSVYFGTASATDSADYQGDQSGLTFDPSTLGWSTNYVWNINAVNAAGTTPSPEWSFTTEAMPLPPSAVTNPSPADGVSSVSSEGTILSWDAASGASGYDVYFGTSSPLSSVDLKRNQPGVTYDPGTLAYSSLYYWRIDSVSQYGTTSGSTWSFGTEAEPPPPVSPPGAATDPIPASGVSGVSVSTTLSWGAGLTASGYDVFIGLASALGPGEYQGNFGRGILEFTPSALDYSALYYWQINSINIAGTTSGVLWNFGTEAVPIDPPAQVANPIPADASSNVAISAILSWDAASGASGYDVYFGTISALGSSALQGNQTGITFDPSTLEWITTYYWQVDALNISGTTPGPTWSFTTSAMPPPPDAVTNPIPADASSNVAISAILSWDASPEASSYYVYFGTSTPLSSADSKGNQTGITFDPDTLDYAVLYYWRVDPTNAYGTTTGDEWSFTTSSMPLPPSAVTNPSPADAAIDVSSEGTVLSWDAAAGDPSGYDVYFGTSSPLSSVDLKINQPGVTYDPGTLEWLTLHYWRIDSLNANGTTSGSTWSFTTIAEPPPPPAPPAKPINPNPTDTATDVSVTASLSWDASIGASGYDIYIGIVPVLGAGEYQGNFGRLITEFTPSALLYSTLYYWRIDAANSAGTTSGDVWSFTTENSPTTATVTTQAVSNISQNSARGNGTVTDDGGTPVTERGVVASLTPTPTTSDLKFAAAAGGVGVFSVGMTGLTISTLYYARAYAINSGGTSYGSEVQFTTLNPPTTATVTTQAVTSVSITTSTGNGTVTSDGGATVTDRGVVASLTPTPTTSDLKFTAAAGGVGIFTVSMTSLEASSDYYARAYAINSVGTSYGNQVQFTTAASSVPPSDGDVVATITVANPTPSSTGLFNYVRGTIPVASGASSFSFYLRDSNGAAWPTDSIVATRGPSSIDHPSGVPQVVELRARMKFSNTTGVQVLDVESGTFSSTESFGDNIAMQLATTAPQSISVTAPVAFTKRIMSPGPSLAPSGNVTYTERIYGELESASIDKLFGYSAYVTTFAGLSDIWLIDMMIKNANVGEPNSPLGTNMLPHILFNEIAFQVQAGYQIIHLYTTPHTTSTHLMTPNANGKQHTLFMGAMKPYRFAVCKTDTNLAQASLLLSLRGFFSCNYDKALWSWGNPDTAFYGPTQWMVPDLDLAFYNHFQATPQQILSGISNGVSFPDWLTNSTTPLGPFHVRGPTDGGQSGGTYIEMNPGIELITEGDYRTLKAYMAITEMDLDRQTGDKQDNGAWGPGTGATTKNGLGLVDTSQRPLIATQWDLNSLQGIFDPGTLNANGMGDWPRLNVNQWRLAQASSTGLLPDYYYALNAFNPFKASHVIRPFGISIPLVWLLNDPLAKEIIATWAIWGRALVHEEGNGLISDSWNSPTGPQTYPGHGAAGSLGGRIGGWGIYTTVTNWFIATPTEREGYVNWFDILAQHHQAAQLPGGGWNAQDQFFPATCDPGWNPNGGFLNQEACGPTGDAHAIILYWEWIKNGNSWTTEPSAAAASIIEVGIQTNGLRGVYNATQDPAWLAMSNIAASGLFFWHWEGAEDGSYGGSPYFDTPVRHRSDFTIPAYGQLSAAPECWGGGSDTFQIANLILMGLTYDPLHVGAWRAVHQMTGTSFGAGPGLGDVTGLKSSLLNKLMTTDGGINTLAEGWAGLYEWFVDWDLNN